MGANGELSTLTNLVRVEQDGGIAVFNFTVEGNHNYFVIAKEYEYGQSCVLVHNSSCPSNEFADPNLYPGIKHAPNYPTGFETVKTVKVNVKRADIEALLKSLVPGKWKKVYKDGIFKGKQISLHFFQHLKTGQIIGLEIKPKWSNG